MESKVSIKKTIMKRQLCKILSLLLILIIFYLGIKLMYEPKIDHRVDYIFDNTSKMSSTIEQGDQNLTKVDFKDTEDKLHIFDIEQAEKRHQADNVTIKLIKAKNFTSILNIEGATTTTQTYSRNVFARLEDIKKSTLNIFFVETRCSTKKMAKEYQGSKTFLLNARQCCAVESTAFMNLDRIIYVFHSCPLSDDFINHSPKYVGELFKYPNVYVVRMNNAELFTGTPVQGLFDKHKVERSLYPLEHMSDVFRYLILWKFGGIYSDLDVIAIRSFYKLGSNWAGMQDEVTVASGVMNFAPDGVGHEVVGKALNYLNQHFDGYRWSSNGPVVITTTMLEECNATSVPEANINCQGNVTVLDTPILYPIHYGWVDDLFSHNKGLQIVKRVKSVAYSIHFWGKLSSGMKASVGSTQAYSLLAREYCPMVSHNCGEYI